jgi:hypothetical protein
MKIVEETIRQINKCQSEQNSILLGVYNNLVDVIPTVHGYHIITHPFNLKQIEPFKALYPFDIQRNNPTLLYFNKKEDDEKTN